MMKSARLYQLIILFLLVLNTLVIGFFVWSKPKKHNAKMHHHPGKIAKEIFGMDEEQSSVFVGLAKKHRSHIDSLSKSQRKLLKPLFFEHLDGNEKVDHDSIIDLIQEIEGKKIEYTYQHYSEVKEILSPDQLEHFDEFLEETLKFILNEHVKHPPPPRNGKVHPNKEGHR